MLFLRQNGNSFVFFCFLDRDSTLHSIKYPHFFSSAVLKFVFIKFLSFFFVSSVSRKYPVGRNCDPLQPNKLFIFSYSLFLCPGIRWRLPKQDEGRRRKFFPSINLNASSVS